MTEGMTPPPVRLSSLLAVIERQGAIIPEHVFSVLLLKGQDALDLVHRLSTNDLRGLRPGGSIRTVLTSEKGRVIDWVEVVLSDQGVFLVVHSLIRDRVKEWITRFIISEDVEIVDGSIDVSICSEVLSESSSSPTSASFDQRKDAGSPDLVLSWQTTLGPFRMHRFVGSRDQVNARIAFFLRVGVHSLTQEEYQALRVYARIPSCPEELNDAHNPLEAGLRSSISFTKGCYVGQEVIARLDAYDKQRRELVLLSVRTDRGTPERGAAILADGVQHGTVTSPGGRVHEDQEVLALGYLDRAFIGGSPVLAVEGRDGSSSSATIVGQGRDLGRPGDVPG